MKKLAVVFFILVAGMAIVSVIGTIKLMNGGTSGNVPCEEVSSVSGSVISGAEESAAGIEIGSIDMETGEAENNSIRPIMYKISDESDKIPDGYIAVLRGGSGEITYCTYVYQTEDGFEYINTTRTTLSWGSTKGKVTIDAHGYRVDMDQLLDIAEEHNSADFVTFPGEDQAHPIDDFKAAYG